MIPVNSPLLEGNEKKYLNECIDTGWISGEGPFVSRFEEGVANYIGRKYATSCSSGTAAINIAIKALELKEGELLYIPAYWLFSVKYLDLSSISLFCYRTYMNTVAILPDLTLQFLQNEYLDLIRLK